MEKFFMPATISFIDKYGCINESDTRNYIRHLIKKGVTGFYVNGSTGEAFLLPIEERMRALEIIREEVPVDALLMAQIGCISTAESIKLAKHAQSVGASAISAIVPFYFKFSWDEINMHFLEIIKHVDLPFCPYYIPHLSGVNISRDEFGTLLKNPQVQYLKYTSNDFYTMQKLKTIHPDVVLFNGFDEMLLSGLSAGADGAIGSTYNFTYNVVIDLVNALRKGEVDRARIFQNKINTFVDLLLSVGLWQGLKYLFAKIGLGSSEPVRPFLPITDFNKKFVDEFIKNHPEFLN